MHKYDTPLSLGNQQYDGHFPVKGEWDFRSGILRVMFGPVREGEEDLYIATQTERKVLAPNIVATLELHDNGEDPAVHSIFIALQYMLQVLEAATAHRFAGLIYEHGEDEFPLDGNFVAHEKPLLVQRPEVKKP